MDCPPPMVSMETVALPNDSGGVFVVSTAATETRNVTASYDMAIADFEAVVAGEVEMENVDPAKKRIIKFQWSRAISVDRRPEIPEGSPVCYDYARSMLVAQFEATLSPGESDIVPLDWSIPLFKSGDLNADYRVDSADQGLLFSKWGTDSQAFDLNRDGTVNGFDLGILQSQWGAYGP